MLYLTHKDVRTHTHTVKVYKYLIYVTLYAKHRVSYIVTFKVEEIFQEKFDLEEKESEERAFFSHFRTDVSTKNNSIVLVCIDIPMCKVYIYTYTYVYT